jgi:hypothetical protein
VFYKTLKKISANSLRGDALPLICLQTETGHQIMAIKFYRKMQVKENISS